MESFDNSGICVSKLVLGHDYNLSPALQSSTVSAAEGQRVASMTACTIAKVRTDESFSLFWDTVQRKAAAAHVTKPRLPRHHKMPPRYETGTATPHFSTLVEAHYRQIYFEVVDHAVSTIRTRFDQPSYAIYWQAEDLITSAHGEDAPALNFPP